MPAAPLVLSAEGAKLAARIAAEIGRVASSSPGEDIYVCSPGRLIYTIPAAKALELARAWQEAQAKEEAGERVPSARGRPGNPLRRAPRRSGRAGGSS